MLVGIVALLAVVAIGAVASVAHRRRAEPDASAGASSSASSFPSASSTQSATALSPIADADPPPSADTLRDAGASPVSDQQGFDPTSARRALDAIAPELLGCKVQKGASVRVRVTFASSGKISKAVTLAPYSGRPAACIATHVRRAQVAPFRGPAPTNVYTLTVPR